MQEILEFIIKNITTTPDDVKIEAQVEDDGLGQGPTTNYLVTVNPTDVGRIIGKEGKVIKAIRTIMRVIAIQKGVHIRVSVVSENDQEAPQVAEPTVTPEEPIVEDDGSITVEV